MRVFKSFLLSGSICGTALLSLSALALGAGGDAAGVPERQEYNLPVDYAVGTLKLFGKSGRKS